MAEQAIKLGGKKQSTFIDKVKELLPEGGELESLFDLRCMLVRMSGDRAGGYGSTQIPSHGRPRYG